jgi:hypothetical protein
VTGLTPTRVVFVGASDELTDSSNFTFNSTTRVLSIGASGSLGGIFLYPFNIGLDSQSQIYSQNSLAGTSNFRLYSLNGISTENVILQMYGKGTPATATTVFERLQVGWDAANTWFTVSSVVTGAGTNVRPIRIYTGTNTSQLILNIDGTINTGGAFTVNTGNITASTGNVSAGGNVQAAVDVIGTIVYADEYLSAGASSTTSGSVSLVGITSGTVQLYAQDVAGTQIFKLPNVAPGGNDRPLIGSTAGIWSWNDQPVLTTSTVTFSVINVTNLSTLTGGLLAGGSTNKAEINNAGELTFSGTGGVVLPHLMQSDATDQAIASATAEQVITFNTDDHHLLITRTSSSRFTITKVGSYLLTFSALATSGVAGKKIVIWVKVNGSNVTNSATYYTFKSVNATAVITVNFIYHFAVNDYFELWMYGDDTGIKLDYTAAVAYSAGVTPAIPVCPSIIMTCNYVGKD